MKLRKTKTIVISSIVLALIALLSVYFVLILTGVIRTYQYNITFAVDSVDKIYDGTPLYPQGARIVDGTLSDGHTVSFLLNGEQTNVGTSESTAKAVIKDTNGADVTDRYKIEVIPGQLTVSPVRITVYSESSDKMYDGEPLTCADYGLGTGELVEGHELQIFTTAELTDVGCIPNTFLVKVVDESGNDVSYLYEIEVIPGQLTVSPIRITVWSGSSDKLYDGEPLTCADCGLENGELWEGHELQIFTTAELTNVGRIRNTVLVKVVDESGNDVSYLYEITESLGELLVSDGTLDDESNPGGGPGGGGDESGTSGGMEGGDGNGWLNPNDPEGGGGGGDEEGSGGGGSGGGGEESDFEGAEDSTYLIVNSTVSGALYLQVASYYRYDEKNGKWDTSAVEYSTDSSVLNNLSKIASEYGRSGEKATVKITEKIAMQSRYIPYYAYGVSSELGEEYTLSYVSYQCLDLLKSLPVSSAVNAEAEMSCYLEIGDELKAALLEIVSANGLDDSLASVATWLRSLKKYNLQYEKYPDGADRILYFLTDENAEGVCRHYASSAAMMYRAMGIPARYCSGFVCNAEAGKDVEIVGSQAHAWVEIYVDGCWFPLEVTGSDGSGNGTESGGESGGEGLIPGGGEEAPGGEEGSGSGSGSGSGEGSGSGTESGEGSGSGSSSGSGEGSGSGSGSGSGEGSGSGSGSGSGEGSGSGSETPDRKELRITVYSQSKVYDGENVEVSYSCIGLLPGHRPEIAANYRNVGVYSIAGKDVKIYDEEGNDVTSLYRINGGAEVIAKDAIKITARNLTVRSQSKSKVYDGTPLTCDEFEIVAGELIEGYRIVVQCLCSQTLPGTAENIIGKVTVYDRDGNDVTTNFNVRIENGTLTVTAR